MKMYYTKHCLLIFLCTILTLIVSSQVKTRKFHDGVPSDYLKKKIENIPVFIYKSPAKFKEYLENPDKDQSSDFINKYAIAEDIDFDFIKKSKVVSE